ncbi:hypothetical protein NC652_003117 [Populus alba x Populus x berolinensis]|nr:hypothetical protein NC652_003117 [Populus alba x Populus x berolinensis]
MFLTGYMRLMCTAILSSQCLSCFMPELDCIDLVRLITQLETLVELLEFHLVVFKTHHRIFSWSLDPRLWKLKCTNTVLPFLERTTFFLYPIGLVIVLSPILILSGFNPSRYLMNVYFSQRV